VVGGWGLGVGGEAGGGLGPREGGERKMQVDDSNES